MKYIFVTKAQRKLTTLAAFVLAVLLIVFLHPTSRQRELLLLCSLAMMAVIPFGLLLAQRSNDRFRAVRLAHREGTLFKSAARESRTAFILCKPVLDSEGHVVDFHFSYVNRSARRLLGIVHHKLSKQSVQSTLESTTSESLATIFARVAATAHTEITGVRLCERTSDNITFLMQVQAMGCGVALSLGQEQFAEITCERTRELRCFAQSIIEGAPISMIATDASGMIIAMNSAAELLTRYRKSELVEQHCLTLLHDAAEISSRTTELNRTSSTPVKAGFDALTAKHCAGEAEQREWTYVRKDGTRVWVNLTMTPLQTPDRKVAGHLGIAFDVTERKMLTDSVIHMARHDLLTGLPNRGVLNDQLAEGIARARRSGKRLAVLMVDVDHFKRINDSLGHSAGDAVLKFVAKQVGSSLRSTDTVARVGGDEFVVVMPDFGSPEDAERCANVILQKICTPVLIEEREIRMTASIGVCLFPDDAETPAELLHKADLAMYEAKSEGRGCARAYSAEMEREAADKLAMEQEIRYGISAGEFELHYQPQVACATGRVTGMEMLLRWKSPKRGNVPPNVFIPVAEEAGLMIELGEWGVAQACRDCVTAQTELGIPLRVAVNLSPRQFAQKNLTAVVKQSLAESGLPAKQFELEITEQMLMSNSRCVMNTLSEIRNLGVSIAIDDFGTGFSSFAYILEYRVDRLKVDRSFVSKLGLDENASAIVRAIIAMGRGLNIELVAEGVETQDQLAFLLRKRCETVQGYLFAKAVPFSEFATTVRRIHSENRMTIPQATPSEETPTNNFRWSGDISSALVPNPSLPN